MYRLFFVFSPILAVRRSLPAADFSGMSRPFRLFLFWLVFVFSWILRNVSSVLASFVVIRFRRCLDLAECIVCFAIFYLKIWDFFDDFCKISHFSWDVSSIFSIFASLISCAYKNEDKIFRMMSRAVCVFFRNLRCFYSSFSCLLWRFVASDFCAMSRALFVFRPKIS